MFLKTLNSIFIPVSKFSSSSSALLKIGDVLKKSRTFTDTDVLNYSELTHDSNPLHFDSEFARNFGYNDRIVHGMLIAALFPRIIASHFPGAIYASQSLQFKLPVYIGEEVVAEVKALNLRVNKDRYMLAHPGGPLATNKAAALAKFLERKLQEPDGLSSINPALIERAVKNAKETVTASNHLFPL